MSTTLLTIEYRCSDDCTWGGCPGHTGTLEYQSCSDAYLFNMRGREIHFERGELEAVIQLLINLGRVDAVNIRQMLNK